MLSLLFLITSALAQCNLYTRREFRELIQDGKLTKEATDFIKGVKCISNNGIYDDFVDSHIAAMAEYHSGAAMFFPFHRLYLLSLEAAMRKCTGNPNIYIPYWDSALDSEAPEKSLIFKYFGGDGDPSLDQGTATRQELRQYGYCINGPFKDLKRRTPIRFLYNNKKGEKDCIRRKLGSDNGDLISINNPEIIDLLSREPDYQYFCEGNEQSHNILHSFIGGMYVISLCRKKYFFFF